MRDLLNPLLAIVIFAIAFLVAYVIRRIFKIKIQSRKYIEIEGLRGFLAIGVFIHHAVIWHQYLHLGKWAVPNSNLYTQLGQTSVAYFFMISSFLFVNKLLNSSQQNFNWKSFFIGRLYRIYPLYLCCCFLIIGIIMHLSDWKIQVDYDHYIRSLLKLFSFTYFGFENINNQELTSIVYAGIVWSLVYEWLFYLSLPLISLIVLKKKPSLFYIVLSIVGVTLFLTNNHLGLEHILSFCGGAIAPIILKYNKRKIDFKKPVFSILTLCCLFLIPVFESSRNIFCKLLIVISFTLIALGSDLFGILKSKTLGFLGSISYSTYLLHGLIIFIIIYYIFGIEEVTAFSNTEYSILICCIAPVLILISTITYHLIEKTFIKFSKK